MRSKSSKSRSASGDSSMTPAVCTTTSTPPNSASTVVEHGCDFGLIGDVGHHHERAAAGCVYCVGGRLGAVTVTGVVHGDGHTVLGEPDGNGAADAARSSGDDGDALGHFVPPRCFVSIVPHFLGKDIRQRVDMRW